MVIMCLPIIGFSQSMTIFNPVSESDIRTSNGLERLENLKREPSNLISLVQLTDENVLTSNQIMLNFPFGSYLANAKMNYIDEGGYRAWGGVIATQGRENGEVVGIAKDGWVRLRVVLLDQQSEYMISQIEGDIHAITRIIISDTNSCGFELSEISPEQPMDITPIEQEMMEYEYNPYNNNSYPTCLDLEGNSPNFGGIVVSETSCETIRLMYTYTPWSAHHIVSFMGFNTIMDHAHYITAITSFTYILSDVKVNYKPVRAVMAHAYESSSVEEGNAQNDLDHYIKNDSKWEEKDSRSNQYKADVNILMVLACDYGGMAMPLVSKMDVIVDINNSYAVTTSHEIGHLMGCEHNREEYSGAEKAIFDGKKAYGYRATNWRTVMAYGNEAVQPRLSFFSDPTKFYNGKAAGDGYSRAASRVKSKVAEFMAKRSNPQHYVIANEDLLQGWGGNSYGISTATASGLSIQPAAEYMIHAGESVTLKEGFHAQENSRVVAYLSDCDKPEHMDLEEQGIVGPPSTPNITLYNGENVGCRPFAGYFCVAPVQGAEYYQWKIEPSNPNIFLMPLFEGVACYAFIGTNAPTGQYTLSVKAVNEYGESGSAQASIFALDEDTPECGPNPNDPKGPVVVEEIDDIVLAPNPTRGDLNIEYTVTTASPIQIYVTDVMNAQLVLEVINSERVEAGNHSIQVDVSDLKSGIYVVSFETAQSIHRISLMIE